MTKDERKKIANEHFQKMETQYLNEIADCVHNTTIYRGNIKLEPKPRTTVQLITVLNSTSQQAIFDHAGEHITVLNFASFTRPGGGFINGSIAQEEALCHDSFLYNVLKHFTDHYDFNFKNKSLMNDGLYQNFALYTPNVIFKNKVNADVLTVAAPNASVYHGAYFTLQNTMYSRIKFLLDIASIHNPTGTLILGAFGCGVFANDPNYVARCFKSLLSTGAYNFTNVVFAIPASDNDKNLTVFQQII